MTRFITSSVIFLLSVLFTSCEWAGQNTTRVTIGFGNGDAGNGARSSVFQRAAVNEAYPTLQTILLSVSTASLSTSDINDLYNENRFTMNDEGNAFVLTDTVVELVVPNNETLNVSITAINTAGYQVFTGEVAISPNDLSEPQVDVAVPLVVDVDDAIPVLASISGCTDSDSDDICDVYEDLFINTDGDADVDDDGQLNRNDTDSDGDSVPDDQDRNGRVTSGNLPTPSNNGYPMFIVSNREPVISDVTVTTSENQPFTLSLPASQVDPDVNDHVMYSMLSEPTYGSLSISDTDIVYSPQAFFTGTDSFMVQAADLAASYTEGYVDFTVTVNVMENNALNNTTPVAVDDGMVEATPGAAVRVNVIANDSDADIAGANDEIRVISASADIGYAYPIADGNQVYFFSDRSDSGTAMVTYTIADLSGAQASAEFLVNLDNIDADGDGLVFTDGSTEHANPINGTTLSDPDDTTDDENGDGFSDWHAAFNADNNGTDVTGSIVTDTIWTVDGSPYRIAQNTSLVVSNDAHLIIEQGVVVKFGMNASMDVYSGSQLSVLGGNSFALATVFTAESDLIFQGGTIGVQPDSVQKPYAGIWTGVSLSASEPSFIGNAAIYFARNNLSITDGSHQVVHSIFSNAQVTGVYHSSDGASEFISNNISHNGSGVQVIDAGDGTRFSHTYITNNDGGLGSGFGGGMYVGQDLSGNLSVENSYFYLNSANNNGGAMWIGSGSKVSILGSSFYQNSAQGGNEGPGIVVDAVGGDQDNITIRDSLFEDNIEEVAGDVVLTPTAAANNLQIGTLLTSLTDFNWTNITSASSGLPSSATNNVFNDSASAIEFNSAGYLQSASPALNIGSVDVASDLAYLNDIRNPTTNLGGTVDTASADKLDAGFHHDRATFSVSANDSSNIPASFTINELQWTPFMAIMENPSGDTPSSFVRAEASFSPQVGVEVIENERILPGGRFAYEISLSSGVCSQSSNFSVSLNGLSSATSLGQYGDSGGC